MGAGAVAMSSVARARVCRASKAVERYLLIRFLRMVRISVADLRAMIEAGHAAGDSRRALVARERSRASAHPGRDSIDLDAVEGMLDTCLPERDVVVYCS